MAANDGTGQNWDITNPEDTDYMKNGAMEIRDLRKGIEIRINKEHDTLADNSYGGEHKAGSAKAYVGTSNPTKRPNETSNLNASDAGRLFVNSSTNVLHTLTAAAQWLAAGAGHLYSIIAGNFIISKRSGTYSYAFHNSNAPALKIAPSKEADSTDFDFDKSIELAPTGNVTVHGNVACTGLAASGNAAVTGDLTVTGKIASAAGAGSGAAISFVPIVAQGTWTGNGSAKTVTALATGWVIKQLIVHVRYLELQSPTIRYEWIGGTKYIKIMNTGSAAGIVTEGTLGTETINVTNNTFFFAAASNIAGVTYQWSALGYKA
jgi:hypothetical protein